MGTLFFMPSLDRTSYDYGMLHNNTEGEGNAMADAIDNLLKASHVNDIILTGPEAQQLLDDLEWASNNWRTHSGTEEL